MCWAGELLSQKSITSVWPPVKSAVELQVVSSLCLGAVLSLKILYEEQQSS